MKQSAKESAEDRQARIDNVLDFSVYNLINAAARDVTIRQAVRGLRDFWCPKWAPVEEVVTVETVLESALRMSERGWMTISGETMSLKQRDAAGHGPNVRLSLDRRVFRSAHTQC